MILECNAVDSSLCLYFHCNHDSIFMLTNEILWKRKQYESNHNLRKQTVYVLCLWQRY